MTLVEIPLQALPSQQVQVTLNNQQTTIDVYVQNNGLLYCNVSLNATMIIAGAQANQAAYVNQYPTAFVGFLLWYTDDGSTPSYENLGTSAHLLFADYNALLFDYEWWVHNNIIPPVPPAPPTGLGTLLTYNYEPMPTTVDNGIGFLRVDPSDASKVLGIQWTL